MAFGKQQRGGRKSGTPGPQGNPNAGAGGQTSPYTVRFEDLRDGDLRALGTAQSRVQNLMEAFQRRQRLTDNEIKQLIDALELVSQFQQNSHPHTVAADYFQRIQKKLQDEAGISIPLPTRKAAVIDDKYRAIADFLQSTLGHVDGKFPDDTTRRYAPAAAALTAAAPAAAALPVPSISEEAVKIAVLYGATIAAAPVYRTNAALVTSEDAARRQNFNDAVSKAYSDYRSNRALYERVLAYLVNIGGGAVRADDLARVVDILVKQRIGVGYYLIDTAIERALDAAQNVGQDRPPSLIDIDLPNLDDEVSDFEIVRENIFALQPAYFAAMFEELKVFQVVDKLVELAQNGILPVGKGEAGNLLFQHWKTAALRVSEAERRSFYGRTLGIPGGDDTSPNRDFKDLFMRFVSAVSSFVRQNTVDNLLRSSIPGAVSQQQIRKSGRDLATNLSSHGYGLSFPMATELQTQINDAITILKNAEIRASYGARDMWQVVEQVSALELGGARNSVKYRTMASAGAVVFAWLAKKAPELSSGSFGPILDISQIQNPPLQTSKPTKDPSDFDLVGACDQWLAVTGTQEESVERAAEASEAPVMPSRPIQIPSVAREMLESVGVPAMAYSAGTKTNGIGAYRR